MVGRYFSSIDKHFPKPTRYKWQLGIITTKTAKRLKFLEKNSNNLHCKGVITPETTIETEEGKSAPARKVKGLTFAETSAPIESVSMPSTPVSLVEANPMLTEDTSVTDVHEDGKNGYGDKPVIIFGAVVIGVWLLIACLVVYFNPSDVQKKVAFYVIFLGILSLLIGIGVRLFAFSTRNDDEDTNKKRADCGNGCIGCGILLSVIFIPVVVYNAILISGDEFQQRQVKREQEEQQQAEQQRIKKQEWAEKQRRDFVQSYHLIRNGMNYSKVVDIAGRPTEKIADSRAGVTRTRVTSYVWRLSDNSDVHFAITFIDDKVAQKAISGLK